MPEAPDRPVRIGPTTAKYLDDRAAESFKRETDLEESIWRSLPLFSGGLLAAGAVVTKVASELPPFAWHPYPITAFTFVGLAAAAFAVAFWWLWQVVRPRDFDYPADDEAIAAYAEQMVVYHSGQGLADEALDNEVLRELSRYMASTFAAAAKSTFSNNQGRLSARSQVLVLLMGGFLLAFLSYAIILTHLGYELNRKDMSHGYQAPEFRRAPATWAEAACSTADACDPGWRLADQGHHRPADQGQISAPGREAQARSRGAPDTATETLGPTDAKAHQDRIGHSGAGRSTSAGQETKLRP